MARAKKKKSNPGQQKVKSQELSLTQKFEFLAKRGWGKDDLSLFTEFAFSNAGKSFIDLKPYWQLLAKAAEIFKELNNNISYLSLEEMVPMLLFGRAYGSFMAAASLSCSGQLVEAWIMLRACLESALYAFYINDEPALAKIWSERSDRDDKKKLCRDTFRIGKIWERLRARGYSLVRKDAKRLYDHFIDFGAHPNELALFCHMERKQDDSGYVLNLINPNPDYMRVNIIDVAETASLVFKIFAIIYPKQFKQPNFSIKIQNFRTGIKPLMYETNQRVKKLNTETS